MRSQVERTAVIGPRYEAGELAVERVNKACGTSGCVVGVKESEKEVSENAACGGMSAFPVKIGGRSVIGSPRLNSTLVAMQRSLDVRQFPRFNLDAAARALLHTYLFMFCIGA